MKTIDCLTAGSSWPASSTIDSGLERPMSPGCHAAKSLAAHFGCQLGEGPPGAPAASDERAIPSFLPRLARADRELRGPSRRRLNPRRLFPLVDDAASRPFFSSKRVWCSKSYSGKNISKCILPSHVRKATSSTPALLVRTCIHLRNQPNQSTSSNHRTTATL